MLDVNQSYTAMKPLKAVIVSARVHPGESLGLKTFRHWWNNQSFNQTRHFRHLGHFMPFHAISIQPNIQPFSQGNASWLVHGLIGFLLSSTAEAQEPTNWRSLTELMYFDDNIYCIYMNNATQSTQFSVWRWFLLHQCLPWLPSLGCRFCATTLWRAQRTLVDFASLGCCQILSIHLNVDISGISKWNEPIKTMQEHVTR